MINKFLFLFVLIAATAAKAEYVPWDDLQRRFAKLSPNPKALSHVRCFFEKHQHDKFQLKSPASRDFYNRCYGKPVIGLDSTRFFAIVDYTMDSDEKRMFIIDRELGEIFRIAVSHGRYKTWFFNLRLKENKNSIKRIKYYSNEIGSMASSSGFFIGGQVHEGEKFGKSMVIHGLEEGINDNACERDVVVHKFFLMSKSKAYMLSSGCLMVSPKYLDDILGMLKGTTDEELILQKSGSLLFIYGPREAKWEESSCTGNFNIVN